MQINLLFLYHLFNLNLFAYSIKINSSTITSIEKLFCQQEIQTCSPIIDDNFANSSLLPVKAPESFFKKCCTRFCSCQLDRCTGDETCCPDTIDYWSTFKQSRVKIFCDYPQLRPYSDLYPNSDAPVKMYTKCLDSFDKENDAYNKCESSGSVHEVDTLIPVTDKAGDVFKNKYCALCRNIREDDFSEWTSKSLCVEGIAKLPNNISNILQTNECNLIYNHVIGSRKTCTKVISKCNVTGHWEKYDPFIEAACLGYKRVYNKKYKNVFCYFCNTDDDVGVRDCEDTNYIVTFSSILRKISFEPRGKLCQLNTIYDPVQELCNEIQCEFPKRILNGKCVRHIGYIGGITYQLFLKFIPSKVVHSSTGYTTGLKESITLWLRKKMKTHGRISLVFFEKIDNSTSAFQEETNSKIIYFIVRVRVSFDAFPPFQTNIIDYMLSINGTSMEVTVLGNIEKFMVEEAVYDEYVDPPIYEPSAGTLHLISADKYTERFPIQYLSFLYTCPFVQVLSRHQSIVRENHSVTFKDYNAKMDANMFYFAVKHGITHIHMCVSTFEKLISPFIDVINPCDDKVSFQAILSLICFSISLAFSFVTLFFYLMLKRLKYTQPGVNNIVLCIVLIVAQVLFQIGDPCLISKDACKIIGIFIHFAWLFLIFWMNICCIHMVRVFRFSQMRQSLYNIPKTTFLYFLYSFFASLILVIVNISTALYRSEGQDIGYGGTACYINDASMIAYVFALPVATIVVTNIILFTIVMVHLKNVPKVQSDKDDRNLVHIYARLSTLTGGTWLVGFTTFFFNIEVLDYIFIILNAPQGLFLFFAFVANKRTLKLALKKDQDDGATPTTYSTYRHTRK